MYDPAALLMIALGLLLAGAVILVALFCVYKLLDRVSRFVVFAALFISLFAISWVQGLATAPGASGDALLSMAAALNAFGQAALAFIGGNGFSLLPELPGAEATIAWASANAGALALHVVFELLSLLALALTAETVLNFFTNVSSWLSVHIDHFEQVVVVISSGDMTPCARAFALDAARGDSRPRAVFSIVREDSGDETYRLTSGDTTRTLSRESLRRRLADAVRLRATSRVDDGHVALVVFRNGRVTVTSYGEDDLPRRSVPAFVDSLMEGTADKSPVPPDDVYSYSLEEIKVRQLVCRLLPSPYDVEHTGVGLGLRPLVALVMGDDIERVVLTTAYLVRNGQALVKAHADGSIEASLPHIMIASHCADRIERRLRKSYPALFSADEPDGEPGAPALTPPATIDFFDSKFDMLDALSARAGDLVLVINTESDLGRAPSLRNILQRRLQLRFPEVEPVFVQYDEVEKPGVAFEDSYGGRAGAALADTKQVLIYGSATESMQAARLLHKALDRMAMLVNLRYGTPAGAAKPNLFDPEQSVPFIPEALRAWRDCDAYGRDSSRATADYSPVERLLWVRGFDELPSFGHGENSDEALREAIGHLEHLRWNAYLVTTGYRPRRWDTLPERYEAALAENARLANPRPVQQVFKEQTVDPRVREHVALVDWKLLPKLDALFERMARETGTYQELLEAGRLKPNQQKDRDIIDDLIS